jgi:hypothetical protein
VDPDPHPDPHHFGYLDLHPDTDPYQDPHQSDKLDPEPDLDLHQFADDKPNCPKCVEYEPI